MQRIGALVPPMDIRSMAGYAFFMGRLQCLRFNPIRPILNVNGQRGPCQDDLELDSYFSKSGGGAQAVDSHDMQESEPLDSCPDSDGKVSRGTNFHR